MVFFLMNSDAVSSVSKYQLFLSAKSDDQGILPESIKYSDVSCFGFGQVAYNYSKSNYIDILKWNLVEINLGYDLNKNE